MSNYNPQGQPQGPGWGHQQPPQGYNQPPAGWQPPQPQKSKVGKAIGFGCLGFVVVFFAIVAIAVSNSGSKNTGVGTVSPAVSSSASTSTGQSKKAAPKLSTVEAFRAYVQKHGTAKEKSTVGHVVRIQGGDSSNGILDQAGIYTDYTGDLMSSDQGSGKLLASLFADFESSRGKSSNNGLVTVYNNNGDMLSNGNY